MWTWSCFLVEVVLHCWYTWVIIIFLKQCGTGTTHFHCCDWKPSAAIRGSTRFSAEPVFKTPYLKYWKQDFVTVWHSFLWAFKVINTLSNKTCSSSFKLCTDKTFFVQRWRKWLMTFSTFKNRGVNIWLPDISLVNQPQSWSVFHDLCSRYLLFGYSGTEAL